MNEVPPMSRPDADRERAVVELFAQQYVPMVRLANLLGADDPEDIVAEAFYQVFRRWPGLRNPGAAVSYLRSVVRNLTHMRLRRLQVARRYLTRAGADPTTVVEQLRERPHVEQQVLLAALKRLPARQREVLVLRYWLDLREAEIAEAMGITPGAVKSHASRGMATLTRALNTETDWAEPGRRTSSRMWPAMASANR